MDIITYPEMPTKENQWSWKWICLRLSFSKYFGNLLVSFMLNNKAAHNSYARCQLGCERETTGEIGAAAASCNTPRKTEVITKSKHNPS